MGGGCAAWEWGVGDWSHTGIGGEISKGLKMVFAGAVAPNGRGATAVKHTECTVWNVTAF